MAAAAVKALLRAGADVEGRRLIGLTPLWWAAGFSKTAAMAEAVMPPLIEAGADPNATSEDGFSCVHSAAANPHPEAAAAAIRLLAAAGADLNRRQAQPEDSRPPLCVAALQAAANIPALLACGADPNATAAGNGESTALHFICSHSSSAEEAAPAVSALLATGAKPTAANVDGFQPIHVAATNPHGDVACACIRLLARAGADVNARLPPSPEWHGGTALHLASVRKRDAGPGPMGEATKAIIRTLVDVGAGALLLYRAWGSIKRTRPGLPACWALSACFPPASSELLTHAAPAPPRCPRASKLQTCTL